MTTTSLQDKKRKMSPLYPIVKKFYQEEYCRDIIGMPKNKLEEIAVKYPLCMSTEDEEFSNYNHEMNIAVLENPELRNIDAVSYQEKRGLTPYGYYAAIGATLVVGAVGYVIYKKIR